ncbi:hypothetical protein J6590_005837 [Homalodisca vitripennis]|nr:hypothetical protein J6590_005837 [Homalodisca vitripennis]
MAVVLKQGIICLTIMYSYKACFCAISTNNEDETINSANKISDFVLHATNKYFNRKLFANVIMPKERDGIFLVMDSILKRISNQWIVVTNETYCCDIVNWNFPFNKPPVIRYHPDVYIIPFYEYDTFVVQINRMQKDDYFNPRAIFILVMLIKNCEVVYDEIKIAQIFNTMWSRNALTVNIVLFSKCDYTYFTIINAQPFSFENPCRTVQSKGLQYFQRNSGEKESNRNFVQYETKDFNGCNFQAGTLPCMPYVIGKHIGAKNETRYELSGGIDIEFMRVLSMKLNFTYTFCKLISNGPDAWFKRLPNGKVIGLLQDVLEHKVDIVFGGIIPNHVTYNHYQYSPSYKFSSLSWYVADPSIAPEWKIIFQVFAVEIWGLLVFIYLTVCLLYWVLEHFKFFRSNQNFTLKFNSIHFVHLLSIALGASSTLNPKHVYLRLLFFFWAIFSFHVYTAYTSALFGLMTHPPLEKEITNIQDLKDLHLKVGVEEIYLSLFEKSEIDSTTRSVLDNHFDCPSIEFCLYQLVRHRNCSVMGKKEIIESTINLKLSKVHQLTDNMISHSINFLTSKGHPLGKGLDKLLRQTLESGLLNKFESDIRLLDQNQPVKVEYGENKKPLNIGDLQGAFGILMNGLIIAILLFVGEIFFNFVGSTR